MLITQEKAKTAKPKKIPTSLIYEVIDGKPVYRKGYKDVLNKKKTLEEIIGSSSLQSAIIGVIVKFLNKNLPDEYIIGGAKMGIHLNLKENMSMDIPIYEAKKITTLTNHYTNVPPKILIEVDIEADTENFENEMDYYFTKTQKLLDFGVEKVIWIFTGAQKTIISMPDKDWQTVNWDARIEVMPNIIFCISELLEKGGFKIEKSK
ncbi:MAG: Uma2 family endonuclease [Cytophagales bacterium]|nr:MAG: Uma2 family endonuclease [Cytophagales bacterium]